MGIRETVSPGPCFQVLPAKLQSAPPLQGPGAALGMGLLSCLGRAGRIRRPSAQAHSSFRASPGSRRCSGDRRQGGTALPSGVTQDAAFQVGTVLTKGPLSSACPGPSCIVLPREGHNGALCRAEKGPCPESSSLGSRLPLRVYPGWARPSERSAGGSCSISSRTRLAGS